MDAQLKPEPAPPANDLDLPTGQRSDKEFETVSALCALHGCELLRAEGFILARHRVRRFFPTLNNVRTFLESSQEL